jgi:hypothetical protein
MTAAFFGHLIPLATGLVGFVGLLTAANLDRLAEFKASRSGFEAKTREIVHRAETAISELQILAQHVAELSLSFVARSGRWGGYSDDEKETIRASVMDTLDRLGLPPTAKQSAMRDWHLLTEFDYTHVILGGSRVPETADKEARAAWDALRNLALPDVPSPTALRGFLTKHNFLTPPLSEYLEDYEHYIVHRAHRRPEVWRDRNRAGHLIATKSLTSGP